MSMRSWIFAIVAVIAIGICFYSMRVHQVSYTHKIEIMNYGADSLHYPDYRALIDSTQSILNEITPKYVEYKSDKQLYDLYQKNIENIFVVFTVVIALISLLFPYLVNKSFVLQISKLRRKSIEAEKSALGSIHRLAQLQHDVEKMSELIRITKKESEAHKDSIKKLTAEQDYIKQQYANATPIEEKIKDSIIDPNELYTKFANISSISDYNKQIEKFKELLAEFPQKSEIHTQIAIAYYMLKDYDNSLLEFIRSSAATPTYKGFINVGHICRKLYKLDEAIVWYNKAIDFNPDALEGYQSRGDVYRLKGDLQNAGQDLRKAQKIAPNDHYTYILLAILYSIQSEYLEAIKYYKTAIKFDSKNIMAYEGISILYEELAAKTTDEDLKTEYLDLSVVYSDRLDRIINDYNEEDEDDE